MKIIKILIIILLSGHVLLAQTNRKENYLNLNKAERLEWFRNLGFGMFIHFSFDSQLGIVISHSMAGASDDYLNRYINELPKTFNPDEFNPKEIATLAKLAGMKYIVFTTKHHSGFCMWDTKTTGFNIMNTPYGKDLVGEYVKATRDAGLAAGFYYSPEDFNFLYKNGLQVRRRFPEPIPEQYMDDYLDLMESQCSELMLQYGPIDIIFFDGGEGPLQEKCKEVVWKLQPDIIVTRGAMETPEQTVRGIATDKPWESCITMGTQWAYKPTNEEYKSGGRLIEILIETRAKGGNLLLNIGPKPDGEIPIEQEANLREIAAWTFINGEAVEGVSPWILPNEENIWFTWKPNEKTLYAFITKYTDWPRGERREINLKSAEITDKTQVSVLGHAGELIEYQPEADAAVYFNQKEDGLHVSFVRAQRIYNNHKWNNPLVLKITNARPALDLPVISTNEAKIIGTDLHLQGGLLSLGDADSLQAGFQYREYAGFVEELYSDKWEETPAITISEAGEFNLPVSGLKPGMEYQFRAYADHPKIRVYGDIVRVKY